MRDLSIMGASSTCISDEQLLLKKEAYNRKHNIFRYLALLFICLLYAYFFGGFFPYTILYLIVLMPLISILHLIITVTMLRISEQLNDRTFVKGETASYRLILQNTSFLYIPYINVQMYIEGQYILKDLKNMKLSLMPFSTHEFKYEMPLLYRGRYDIGIKLIKIYDLLGIFSYSFSPFEKKSILVKPRIVNINYKDVPVAHITEGEMSSGYKEIGNDEIKNIRSYVYGDSFRKIHWKLSSKIGKMMVKETSNELDNNVLIYLNLQNSFKTDEAKLKDEDCLIEELVAQINYFIKCNIPATLCYFKNELQSLRASTVSEFQSIYQLLSEIKFYQIDPEINYIDYLAETELACNLVYIFTIVLDGDIIKNALKLKNKGFDVELYYIHAKDSTDDNKAYQEISDILGKNNIRSYKLDPTIIELEHFKKTDKVDVEA